MPSSMVQSLPPGQERRKEDEVEPEKEEEGEQVLEDEQTPPGSPIGSPHDSLFPRIGAERIGMNR